MPERRRVSPLAQLYDRHADTLGRRDGDHIKRIDANHLVSVGDEGFYCKPGGTHWTENCGEGVDSEGLTRLRNVDVMSFHLYPDLWGTTVDWGTDWIASHFAAARRLGKAAMLGEFGLKDKSARNPSYKRWLDTAFASRGAGALYWILSGKQDDGTLYPDYDGFTVYSRLRSARRSATSERRCGRACRCRSPQLPTTTRP